MFDGIRIEKLEPERYDFFRRAVAKAELPSLSPSALEEAFERNTRLTFLAHNNGGFCGTISYESRPVGYWVANDKKGLPIRGQELLRATEILGAYAPAHNKVPYLVQAMADCILNEITTTRVKSGEEESLIVAMILGEGSGDTPRTTEEYSRALMTPCPNPEFLGNVRKGAEQAARWAQSRMTCVGYDPVSWGPVYAVRAKDVRTQYHFYNPIPRLVGIKAWKE